MKTKNNTFTFDAGFRPRGIFTPEEALRGMYEHTDEKGTLCLPAWLFDENKNGYYEFTMRWDCEDAERFIAGFAKEEDLLRTIAGSCPDAVRTDITLQDVFHSAVTGTKLDEGEKLLFGILVERFDHRDDPGALTARSRALRALRLLAMNAPRVLCDNELTLLAAASAVAEFAETGCRCA